MKNRSAFPLPLWVILFMRDTNIKPQFLHGMQLQSGKWKVETFQNKQLSFLSHFIVACRAGTIPSAETGTLSWSHLFYLSIRLLLGLVVSSRGSSWISHSQPLCTLSPRGDGLCSVSWQGVDIVPGQASNPRHSRAHRTFTTPHHCLDDKSQTHSAVCYKKILALLGISFLINWQLWRVQGGFGQTIVLLSALIE